MQNLFFWRDWPKDYRVLLYILGFLFVASVLLLWVYYFMGDHAIISWERIQEQKVVETTIHSFRLGPFQLSIPSESYVIYEYLGGTDLQHNVFASGCFIVVLLTAVVFLLSLITTLDKFWYFAGMGLFILFVIVLRLDVLQVFGATGYVVPGTVLFAYLILAFYFRYFKPHTSLLIRITTFALLTAVLAITVALFANVASVLIHMVVTAYTPALVLSMLFLIMIAHEIIVSFVYITSQGSSGKNVGHFSLITFIYIVNVVITCLHEIGGIHWDFLYINLFLLATISGILGIWGFKLREPLYENIFSFAPFGALFYLALGSICYVTIAQLLGNANDAAIQVVRFIIIVSHAGFGLMFIIYFISNFLIMMGNSYPVYDVLYKPNRMPYVTYRFAGIVASLAFLFYSNWRSFVDHGIAGFYNYVGDMRMAERDELAAITFYEQSKNLSFQNHRANYALGTLKSSRMNFEASAYNYQLANGKRPSEFSLVNAGNLSLWTGKYFDALKAFRNAEKISPDAPVIKNNLGFVYAKIHNLDSAGYYLSQAREDNETKHAAEANFFAMVATEIIPVNADSILKLFGNDAPAVKANALALATVFNQKIDIPWGNSNDKKLNLYTATLLNNYINYHVDELDTAFIRQADEVALDSNNYEYKEALRATLAHAYYHQGNIYEAMKIMGELAYVTQKYQGKFNYIMGLWALDQDAPHEAANIFVHAETAEYKNAKFYRAIALTEAGLSNEAELSWDSLIARDDAQIKQTGLRMKKILNTNASSVLKLSDAEKYQFCRYRIRLSDTVIFRQIVNTFESNDYKAQALLDIAKKFYKADKIVPAIRFFNEISGLQLTDQNLYENIRHFELLMLASRKELNALAKQINDKITFGQDKRLHKMLYTALISEASGDVKTAEKNYAVLATSNPFFDEGILAAADFYKRQSPQSTRAYDILVEAIYINQHSVRLLKAYRDEAKRKGFDEYAASADERARALEAEF